MTDKYKAYFARKPGSIEGLFTLHKNGKPIFKQMRARSGTEGYQQREWIPQRSPIPYTNKVGIFCLWLDAPVSPGAPLPTGGGIGEFYQISNTPLTRRFIKNPKGPEFRQDIGLHPENEFRGSAGCIVLLHSTPEEKAQLIALFKLLRTLGKTIKFIELEVLP